MKKILLWSIFGLALILRIYRLGDIPAHLYWDEASLGYNAYSISQTLHDEHGEFLPQARFIAFGDYKAPGYIYADALTIKLLGLSAFTIRLPSALAGTLLVVVTYFLVRLLFAKEKVALASALFVAISPWSLQLSRAAFEANLATLFSALGGYLFLRGVRRNSVLSFIFCALSFSLSMYSFNSHRIFVPLLIAALLIIFRRELLKNWQPVLFFVLPIILLLLPLAVYGRTREAGLRFYEVTWLNDLDPIKLSNSRIVVDGQSLVGKVLHNRRVVYALEFLKHYTDHFRPDYLFTSGDVNPKLSIQTVGELYLLDLPFLLAGIYFLIKRKDKSSAVLFSWVLLAPIPAAFARETPHALRTLNMLPIPQIFVALGVVKFFRWRYLIILLYLGSFILYLSNYYFVYTIRYASFWQDGYRQMVNYVSAVQADYDHVSVTERYGRPYIYFLLYQKYPPEKYWKTRQVERDWYGFWYVHGFDKYVFGEGEGTSGRWLYVRPPGRTPPNAKLLDIIRGLNGEMVFEISQKNYQ